jgi:hypothetical protein
MRGGTIVENRKAPFTPLRVGAPIDDRDCNSMPQDHRREAFGHLQSFAPVPPQMFNRRGRLVFHVVSLIAVSAGLLARDKARWIFLYCCVALSIYRGGMDAVKTFLENQPLFALFLAIAVGYLVGEINTKRWRWAPGPCCPSDWRFAPKSAAGTAGHARSAAVSSVFSTAHSSSADSRAATA